MKKIIIILLIGLLIITGCSSKKSETSKKEEKEENLEEKCEEQSKMLQTYIDNHDAKGFDEAYNGVHLPESKDASCTNLTCKCPSIWNQFLTNKTIKADDFIKQGLISSAYNEIGYYIDDEKVITDYYDKTTVLKLLSSRKKDKRLNTYNAEWKWKYVVGGSFKFNRRSVNYGSSSLSLQFGDYFDKVLISGHLQPKNHTNWNAEKNISVNYYNYKVLNNIIYVKLENEADNKYDGLFQIVSVTDTKLKLKLLLNLSDVNKGQVYEFNYSR